MTDRDPYCTVADAFRGLEELSPNEDGELSDHEAPRQRESTIQRCRETGWGEQLYDSYETNKRLHPHEPAPTVLGKDWKYAHPHQPRGITIRERARLQTFPDWFSFVGKQRERRQIIANAVPVDLVEAVVDELP